MRQFLIDSLAIYSAYEFVLFFGGLALPLLVLIFTSYKVSRSTMLLKVYALSFPISLIATALVSYGIQYLWEDVNTGRLQVALYLGLLIMFLSYIQLFYYYRVEMGEKRFDPDHVTRSHFKFSLDTGIVTTLLITSAIIFTNGSLRVSLVIALATAVITLINNHLFAKFILKDKVE